MTVLFCYCCVTGKRRVSAVGGTAVDACSRYTWMEKGVVRGFWKAARAEDEGTAQTCTPLFGLTVERFIPSTWFWFLVTLQGLWNDRGVQSLKGWVGRVKLLEL